MRIVNEALASGATVPRQTAPSSTPAVARGDGPVRRCGRPPVGSTPSQIHLGLVSHAGPRLVRLLEQL